MKISMLLAVLLVLSHPVWAATIVVDETTCTLVDAIDSANTDTAVGGCVAGSGPDTIELTTDVTLTEPNNGDTGLPVVETEITIEGRGFTIERDRAALRFRLLLVTGTLGVNDTMLTNGSTYSSYSSHFPAGSGGGILNLGSLTLTSSTLSGNSASGYYPYGGGIHNLGSLTLTNSTLSGNTAGGYYASGGGIGSAGSVSLTNSTVSGNSAASIFGWTSGGGVAVWDGELSMTNSTLSGNTATAGGGLHVSQGSASVTNSTLANNTAFVMPDHSGSFDGGGFPGGYASGGGIFLGSGSLSVTSSTLSGNTAVGSRSHGGGGGGGNPGAHPTTSQTGGTLWGNTAVGGDPPGEGGGGGGGFPPPSETLTGTGGGIHVAWGSLSVTNSTLSGNSANSTGGGIHGVHFPVVVSNSIVANSPSGGNCGVPLTITDLGNNFADDDTCGPGFASIAPGPDFDEELADNGGSTQTHALFPGSLAIDAAGECGLDTDQRGFLRWDGACDSGSFEYGGTPPDADQDGILDAVDVCLDTTIPESVPTHHLGVNRWALVDGDTVFDSRTADDDESSDDDDSNGDDESGDDGDGPHFGFTLEETRGCSCEQIIEAWALGWGHTKFGCSTGIMSRWVATVWNYGTGGPEIEPQASPEGLTTIDDGGDDPFASGSRSTGDSGARRSPSRPHREAPRRSSESP